MNLPQIPTAVLSARGLESTSYTATSLADAATKEPDGVYTTARTYQRDRVLLFDDHIDRLEQSARLVGLNIQPDRKALRQALRTLIDQAGYAESRFRISAPHAAPDTLILSIEPYQPVPPDILEDGARCTTVQIERHTPAAKTTAWMTDRKSATDNLPPGTYEGLLVTPEGALLEGLSSNFYAVLDGTLHTAGAGVLPGMAQKIVLSLAPDLLPVTLTPITINDLRFIDEAFISSAGRGVVPVIMVNTQVIGNMRPSSTTLALRDRYNAYADAHMELL